MRTQHPLFGFNPLGDAWDVAGAGHDFTDDRRDALIRLADARDQLPAPVYFQVPAGAIDDERWQRLVSVSQPQCGCPPRRMLVPKRGRARFIPHTTPQRVTVRMREDGEGQDSLQAAIVPHGGDLVTAHLAWGLHYNWPICLELPLIETAPRQQSVTFGGAVAPNYRDGRMCLGDDLADVVRRRGEVICYRTLRNDWERVTFPVCSIVEAAEDQRTQFVIELDAGVTHQIIDPYNMPQLHVCRK